MNTTTTGARMRVTKRTTYSITIDHDGTEIELPVPFEPYDGIEPYLAIDGDLLTLRYAVLDEDRHDDGPLEEDEAVEVTWFRNGEERDEWLADNELGERDFLIERYEHGLVHHSVANTGPYPDRRWDVAVGVGVLRLDGDWEGDLRAIANDLLDNYSSWCNGDVYGVGEAVYRRSGEGWERVDADFFDSVWGFIGTDYAQTVVREGY